MAIDRGRALRNTKYNELKKMYYRVHCHKTYGGFEWLAVLIALGDVPPLAVDIANEIIAERVRLQAGREAGHEMQGGARLSKQSLARRRNEPVPAPNEGKRKQSKAKEARHRAKQMELRYNKTSA